ncbi:MAG: GHMP kinase [Candidatus Sumerlaeia bacterium]|nr:GHMP kinase [Candidatus Sumerlaeia bacterium]
MPDQIVTSAPGRICLFGEHQDYLGLPVIACAIDLRVTVSAVPSKNPGMTIHLPDVGRREHLDPSADLVYTHDRDYLPAAINVLRREGATWHQGWDIQVTGNIPINSGTSSSSALQIAWCSFLLAAAGDERATDPQEVARLAHLSEVVEFGSPGGMMDHYSSAVGGTIWLDCGDSRKMEVLPHCPGEFVLVDSGIPKDTNNTLGTTRKKAESIDINPRTMAAMSTDQYLRFREKLPADLRSIFTANRENALLTNLARHLLAKECTAAQIADLLNEHHIQLAENLGVSHPEIDRMIYHGMDCGALGGKINGSGMGGTFYLLCEGNGRDIQREFTAMGLRAFLVKVGDGLRCTRNQDP